MGPCTPLLRKVFKTAEHPIGTLSPCGTSIVYLLGEFVPFPIAVVLLTDTFRPHLDS